MHLNPCLHWDIFCRVIDNHGDIGVCWRLAVNLAQRGQTVRLWVDQPGALAWMAPNGAPGVQVLPWVSPAAMVGIKPGEVLVEAFGCEIDPEFIAAYAYCIRSEGRKCLWINLEYLTAEPYAQRCHGLPSPVMSGPGKGLIKHFFYPGFCPGTGGLLREPDLLTRQAGFDRTAWLAAQSIDWRGERLVSLFCYEPTGLAQLLDTLAEAERPSLLLVTPGRAADAVKPLVQYKNGLQPNWNKRGQLSISYLSELAQTDYDHLLWACELNFVRGEDSLVRALWAGQPLVWQIYPQHDGAHLAKLGACLDWLQAPDGLRAFHAAWNGLAATTTAAHRPQALPLDELPLWRQTVAQARQRLLGQPDLTSALLGFTAKTN